MRKRYIAPEVEIVKIEPLRLLAGSDPDAIKFDGIDDMDGFGGTDNGDNEPS